MKEKLYNFLKGRNGADELAKVFMYISIVLLFIGYLTDSMIVSYISLILIIYANFRVFSKNIKSRVRENKVFLSKVQKVTNKFLKKKNRVFGKDGFKYFECSECKQELRVPKNKGKLKVKCPRCSNIQEIKS